MRSNPVLIVDDEQPIRTLMTRWVESIGCAALPAASAEEALEVAAAEPPAVALCDIRMPGHDGLWLAQELTRRHAQTMIIMTTGVQEFQAALASLQAGVLDYLVKPFGRERLCAAVEHGLARHRERVMQDDVESELRARTEKITDALAEFEINSSATLEAMLAMLTIRDRFAYNHAHRVAKLTVDLALAMEVSEPELSEIERAALLHDLGKITLPEEILRKRGPLTEAEMEILRSHSQRGYDLLAPIPFLARAAEIILASHERYDGKGYPCGLRGAEIPLGARILAVADTYDAIAYERAYRAAGGEEHAIVELERSRGTQFDPEVLDTFLKLFGPSTSSRKPGARDGALPITTSLAVVQEAQPWISC